MWPCLKCHPPQHKDASAAQNICVQRSSLAAQKLHQVKTGFFFVRYKKKGGFTSRRCTIAGKSGWSWHREAGRFRTTSGSQPITIPDKLICSECKQAYLLFLDSTRLIVSILVGLSSSMNLPVTFTVTSVPRNDETKVLTLLNPEHDASDELLLEEQLFFHTGCLSYSLTKSMAT